MAASASAWRAGWPQAGAAVAVAGRNKAKSEAAAAELAKLGVKTAVIEVDVTDEASCRKAVADTAKTLGRLDILINNAGINIRKPAHELALEEWKQVIDVNLTSMFVCCQAAYPPMQQAGGGKIINIGSMLSIFGAPFAPAYGASKGGVVQLTKSLATAWAKDNIQVNAVLPGWIDTDLTRAARERDFGAQLDGADAHAGAALGHARGHVRHRRVPGQQGVRLRHRHGHCGGWRVLDPGVSSDPRGPGPISPCRSRRNQAAGSGAAGTCHRHSFSAMVGPLCGASLVGGRRSRTGITTRRASGAVAHERHQPDRARHRDARQSL